MFTYEVESSRENEAGYITSFGGVVVLRLRGELDLATERALKDLLDTAVAPPATTVLVDLSRVSFIDASSVGQIVVTWHEARERGVYFGVEGLARQPARVFSVLRLEKLVLRRTPAVPEKGGSG